jgi:Predicted membrane protein
MKNMKKNTNENKNEKNNETDNEKNKEINNDNKNELNSEKKNKLSSEKGMDSSNKLNRQELFRFATLAFSGGLAGAFSYMMCDEIFANAQTGNLLHLTKYISEGDSVKAMLHLIPFFVYLIGISGTVLLPMYLKKYSIRWETICLLLEAACMGLVSLLPTSLSPVIYITPVFFASALQYNTFKTCNGVAVSTLFCTNNIRQLVISFWKYRLEKDKQERVRFWIYAMVLVSFLSGAISSFLIAGSLKQFTILISCMILIVNCFVIEAHSLWNRKQNFFQGVRETKFQ